MQNMNQTTGQMPSWLAQPRSNQQGRDQMSRYTGPQARPANPPTNGIEALRTMFQNPQGQGFPQSGAFPGTPNAMAMQNANPNAAFMRPKEEVAMPAPYRDPNIYGMPYPGPAAGQPAVTPATGAGVNQLRALLTRPNQNNPYPRPAAGQPAVTPATGGLDPNIYGMSYPFQG